MDEKLELILVEIRQTIHDWDPVSAVCSIDMLASELLSGRDISEVCDVDKIKRSPLWWRRS